MGSVVVACRAIVTLATIVQSGTPDQVIGVIANYYLFYRHNPENLHSLVRVNIERRLVGLVRRRRRLCGMRGRRHGWRGVRAVGAPPLAANLLFAPPLRAPIREPYLNVGLG